MKVDEGWCLDCSEEEEGVSGHGEEEGEGEEYDFDGFCEEGCGGRESRFCVRDEEDGRGREEWEEGEEEEEGGGW